MKGKTSPGRALILIASSTLLAMSVWFSASFVLPQLAELWALSPAQGSLLTIAVQLGFVVGAVVSAVSGMADAISARTLFVCGAAGAAVSNVAIIFAAGASTAVSLRFLTGVCLAAVYPSALKLTSTWFVIGRGKALGIMIGALTIGSASPHAVRTVADVDWQTVMVANSVLTLLGGILMLTLRHDGPHQFPRRKVTLGAALASLRNRDVLLADLGYVGHMWELYAMWATIGTLLATLPAIANAARGESVASGIAFACIGIGAIGCWVGGVLSDRRGRAEAARLSMACSGGAAIVLAAGLDVFPTPVIILVCMFWGFWVIADSAQFSALVSEKADPAIVGGALSLQLALGFVTTAVTIWLVPVVVDHTSWRVALVILALGPAVGIAAMSKLIALPNVADPATRD